MPAAYVPEHEADFGQNPQAVEETVLGTTPASPTFFEIGKIHTFNVTDDTLNHKFRVLGSEDLLKAVKTGEAFAIQLGYAMFNTQFAKYGINARGAGAGSIDKSLSILWAHKVNAALQYEIASMCRINTGSISITPDMVDVNMTIIAGNKTAPNAAHGLGSPVFITPSAVDPFVGFSGGANPLTHNSLNYDIPTFTMNFARNLHAVRVNGQLNIIDNPSTIRVIDGSFDVVRKDQILKADARSLARRSAAYTIASGPITLTFVDMIIQQLQEGYGAADTEIIEDTYGYEATSVQLTG